MDAEIPELFRAIAQDDVSQVISALKLQDSDPLNDAEAYGELLYRAVVSGADKVAEFFLQCGTDPNARYYRTAPLHVAVKDNDLCLIEILLRYGADTKAKDGCNLPPVLFESWQAAKLIYSAGKLFPTADETTDVAISWALQNDNVRLMHFLLNLVGQDQSPGLLAELLHHALRGDSMKMVKYLLAAGVPLDCKFHGGDTLLHSAAYGDADWAVPMLIRLGGELESRNEEGETAVMVAARRGHSYAVSALLAEGSRVEARNFKLETPLKALTRASGSHSAEAVARTAAELIGYGAASDSLDRSDR